MSVLVRTEENRAGEEKSEEISAEGALGIR